MGRGVAVLNFKNKVHSYLDSIHDNEEHREKALTGCVVGGIVLFILIFASILLRSLASL